MVCQNLIPYLYLCYPFWKHHRFSRTRSKPWSHLMYLTPIVLTTKKPAHPHFVGQNRAPTAQFLVFLALTAPPSHTAELQPPSTSNSMFPTPVGSPLSKNQPTHHSLAKTKPLPLGFWIFAHNKPPLAHHWIVSQGRTNATGQMRTNKGRQIQTRAGEYKPRWGSNSNSSSSPPSPFYIFTTNQVITHDADQIWKFRLLIIKNGPQWYIICYF